MLVWVLQCWPGSVCCGSSQAMCAHPREHCLCGALLPSTKVARHMSLSSGACKGQGKHSLVVLHASIMYSECFKPLSICTLLECFAVICICRYSCSSHVSAKQVPDPPVSCCQSCAVHIPGGLGRGASDTFDTTSWPCLGNQKGLSAGFADGSNLRSK